MEGPLRRRMFFLPSPKDLRLTAPNLVKPEPKIQKSNYQIAILS
jgi:hypothetical protein